MAPTTPLYQVRISFDGIEPAIWRRISIPPRTTLRRLHLLIDEAFGLAETESYRFSQNGREWGRLMPGGDYVEDDARCTIRYCLPLAGQTLAYRNHSTPMTIVLEGVLP